MSTTRPALTIVGVGYLGTTHALCLAELGYDVIGVDIDAGKIEKLNSGTLPFHEPGLDSMLTRNLAAGRVQFTTSYPQAAAHGDIHFICVGTPQRDDTGAADVSGVHAAVTALAPHLRRRSLVVGRSTVPVGTAHTLAAELRAAAPVGGDAHLAWNPEFLREGFAVNDTLRPDRLVFGVTDDWSKQQLNAAYRGVYDLAATENREVPTVVTDLATAELAKTAANAFLATKISFINAVAEVCEASGADVTDLARALGHDRRIGPRFLRAGIGFGGGCLPKDIRALRARAAELGVGSAMRFLDDVDSINQRRRAHAVDIAAELTGGLASARVAVLGATFKPDTDDVRDSPALAVAASLVDAGAIVSIYDPVGVDSARATLTGAHYCHSAVEAADGADLVMVLTEWEEFIRTQPEALGSHVRQRRIVDGRNCLDAARWRAAGWTYRGMGRR